ncbi:putative non-ribosomal peptide synthetase [Pilimelia terevasa]|uniref:Putative non-ribosomal peptide synthetase n=1 Tax=Pilimelia terevasa TaxID=53372 RepID=A0A8J3BSH4_9ACTN|nr:non-ribosomal peptide synthetase [Pilimelia terevasa]GGK35985.1 putative non-ribosomal peptide synthetase [Pilimelia terevasa]
MTTLALTGAQLGIWNAQRLEPESPYYLVGDVVEVRGDTPVDAELLADAIQATVGEAECLRLRVTETADGPRQSVAAGPAPRPRVLDLSGEADPAAAAHAFTAAERQRLARQCRGMVDRPLFAYTVLRLSAREVWFTQLGHHLVFDGYTAAMLARRTAAHYTALVTGATAPAATFGAFADLVAADRAYREGPDAERDRRYWVQRFTPLPELGDGAAPAGPPSGTRTAHAVLPPEEVAQLKAAADATGITWGEGLIAAYAALLHRVLGGTEVVFAVPLMCRTGAALRTPAMAVNVLPARLAVRGGDDLASLGRRVAGVLREMRAHQRYRGEDLPRDLAAPGAGALLHGRGVNLKAFDLAIDFADAVGVMRNVAGGPPEDMGLAVLPTRAGGLALTFEVDARTHDQAAVDARLTALRRLLAGLVAGVPVGRVELLDSADLLREWSPAPVAGAAPDVSDLVDALDPAAVALVCGADRLTGAELAGRVHGLARTLRERGVGRDDVVALALPRSADLVVALLAVLDAGAAFLPLDVTQPAARLRQLAAGARLTIATPSTADVSPVPVLAVSVAVGPPLSEVERHPDDLAYVIHTSGSTGAPKGVLGRRGALAELVHGHRHGMVADAAAGRRLRVAHTYSFAFDSALDQLLWLLCGHELHVYDAETARDPGALLAAYARDRIDVVDTTPSMAGPLVDGGLLDGPHRPALLVLGGEATPPALWERVAASGVAARNLYGPTEATVDGTAAAVSGDAVTIGGPLPGTRAYVLDGALRPAHVGELYLAGPRLARGYRGLPGATAERFVADPYGAPGDRMYRTGDLARWTPRGLEYRGRRDGQVKVRGYRVEVGEVEAALGALPGVAAAAAAVRGGRLVGYVVGGELDPAGVRAALAGRVPEHLVPAAVVVLDALPTTAHGKLDRAALPAPRVDGGGRAPATAAQRLLCATVGEVLGAAAVGVDDDFFALGGDSITAISVTSRLRAHGLELAPRELLARRSFADVAAAARRRDEAPAVPDEPVGPVPAPPIVRALLEPNEPRAVAGYAQWTALRLDARLPLADLDRGLRALLEHHDALRLRASPAGVDIRPRGSVLPDARELRDAADRSPAGLAAVAERLAATLDPAAGELLRAALVRAPAGEPDRLVLVIHHLAVDGVSWRVLLADLRAACAGEPLAPVGTSWRRHAILLAERGESGAHRGELAHWRDALDGDRIAARPLDPAADTVATAAVTRTLATPQQTAAVLTALPAAYRAGVDEILLAALTLALRRWKPLDSVSVTMEGHGRDRSEVDLARTVGWFTSEHPVRVPTAGDVGRLLRAAKEAARALPGVGYGVLRHLDPTTREELSATPPPDVLLNYLGRFAPLPDAGWHLPEGDPFAVVEPPAKALEQLLALNCFVAGDRLAVEWTAASTVLPAAEVARLQRAWAETLEALAGHVGGGLTPSDLPLVDLDQAAIDAVEADGPVTDILPATPLQVGLTYHTLLGGAADERAEPPCAEGDRAETPTADVYVVQAVARLSGPVDTARMRDAAAELLRRHPALRAHLHLTAAGDVVQVLPADVRLEWRHIDGGLDAALREELDRPFSPTRPPLIRFLLAALAPDDHRLAITIHHALLDGWSMPLVGRALLATYAELGGGPPAPVAPSPTAYHRWLAGRDRGAALAAWERALAGAEGTRLAPTTARATVGRPARVAVDLGPEFSAELRRFARERGVTLATVLNTAWGILLGRLTGRRDVVFGCPVSGRPAEVPGVEATIGQLGSAIPVRVAAAPAEPVAALLDRVQAEATALAEHHHLGLPDIQRAAGAGELFDTMLVVENFPLSDRTRVEVGPGLALTGVDITDATHYPLTVIVIPGDDIRIGLGYQPEAFGADTAAAYGRGLRHLLRQIVAGPDTPVARLAVLDAAERDQVLGLGVGPEPRRPVGGVLAEFAAWVRRTPDAEAVVCRDRTLTYAELDRRANRLTHALLARGVRAQDRVAVLLGRDVEMPVALLGVLKAGAVYVPMDPAYPRERLAYMLADAAPTAAVATDGGHADLPAVDPTAPGGPRGWDADPVHARRGLTPDALAYVIYTSGTTGRPKGVGVPLRGVPSLVSLQEDVVGIGTGERYLHFASTSFDVAVWQTLLPLLSGGASVIAPDEVRLPGDELLDYAAAQRVTGMNLLPSFLAAMPDDAAVDPGVFFVVGAERLDPALAARWGRGRRALFNAYGPTEVTVNSVTWRYDRDDAGPLPIGRPDPLVRAYVLDGGLLPVGVGAVGELYLAGPKLARGYLNRPGLTAGRFVADPFGPPGERMYRTGDLARWRPDGQLVFLGRTDAQVKLRGFRIELPEIETVLSAHPDVRGCAVVVRGDRLVAYVIGDADAAALTGHLAAQLPEHMVPSAVVFLDRLPLTPAGKLDQAALPAPERARGGPAREPATPAEATLLRVLREVLGRDVTVDDAFLDVGGDSIASLRVVSRARRAGLALTARDVFEGRTVAGIAARCGTPAQPAADAPAVGDAPLTPVMRDLLRRAGSAADRFCQWVEVCVPAGGEARRWRTTLDAVLARHDVLRAHLAGGALRIPAPGTVTGADVLVHVRTADGDVRARVDAAVEAARAAMNLRTPPLLRAIWCDPGAGRPGRLVLVAHHALVDAVSWRVLLDDLAHAYGGGELTRHGQSFLGWARSLRAARDGRAGELPFWARVTAGPPALGAALDPARDTAGTARHHHLWLDAATTGTLLTALPAAYRCTPDAVLLTALARAVAAWRGTAPDLLVALESHGRPPRAPDGSGPVDLSATVGWFTAVHPARIAPPAGPAAVAAVRDHLAAAGDGLGHGILDADGRRPEVSWNYLGRFPAPPAAETPWQPAPDADPLGSGGGADLPLPYPLMIDALVRDDTLGVRFTWPEALFGAADVAALAGHFADAARALCAPAGVLPLTPLQEVLLRHPEPYTVQAAFHLDGPLDLAALRAAAGQLVRRHPHLGAVFPPGHAVQVVPPAPRVDVREADSLDDELAEPFDLATGPLLRVAALRRGPHAWTLALTSHHLLSDGWSAPRILAELFAGYAGTPLPAPVPLSRYTDWLAGRDRAADIAAWRDALADLPEGDALTRGRDHRVAAAAPVLFTVPAPRVAALTAAAARRGLTPNTLLQGAWAAVLAARSGRPEACFGVMVSARDADVDGIEEIIGLLANTVPARARFTGTVGDALADLQARQQALAGHSAVGLGELTELTGRRRLFDSMVVFENYPVDPARLREPAPGLTVTGARFRERTHHPVTVTVVPGDGGWSGVLAYQAGMFTAGEAAALADALQSALAALPGRLDEDAAAFVAGLR